MTKTNLELSGKYMFNDLQARANELMKVIAENPQDIGTETGIKRVLEAYSLSLIAKDMLPVQERSKMETQLQEVLQMAYDYMDIKARREVRTFSDN